jgi:hypothetical protein
MSERRLDARSKPTEIQGWIRSPGLNCNCLIIDVSPGGARLVIRNQPGVPEQFYLFLSPRAQSFRHCIVRWRHREAIGVEFSAKNLCRLGESIASMKSLPGLPYLSPEQH